MVFCRRARQATLGGYSRAEGIMDELVRYTQRQNFPVTGRDPEEGLNCATSQISCLVLHVEEASQGSHHHPPPLPVPTRNSAPWCASSCRGFLQRAAFMHGAWDAVCQSSIVALDGLLGKKEINDWTIRTYADGCILCVLDSLLSIDLSEASQDLSTLTNCCEPSHASPPVSVARRHILERL